MFGGDGLFVRFNGDHHYPMGRYLRGVVIGLVFGFLVGP
jgi:hypothetical protein